MEPKYGVYCPSTQLFVFFENKDIFLEKMKEYGLLPHDYDFPPDPYCPQNENYSDFEGVI